MSNSRFVFAGVSWRTLELDVPHCKKCADGIDAYRTKRFAYGSPAILVVVIAYLATSSIWMSLVCFSVACFVLNLIAPKYLKVMEPGVTLAFRNKNEIIVKCHHKPWLADLLIYNA
jgi:hypothetical protein